MSETSQTTEERSADLRALHQQLEELATRTRRSSAGEANRAQVAHGPVLVIRGK